jgi:hypothetical protein
MTTPRRIRDSLTEVAHLVALLRDRLHPALVALRRELDDIDGFPSSASGADRQRGGTAELTSVEAAAHARLGDLAGQRRMGASTKLDAIGNTLAGVTAELRRLLSMLDGMTPVQIEYTRVRCIGDTGEPHSYLWVNATCENVAEPIEASRLGLCVSCRQRRTRALRDAEREAS